MRKRIKEFQIVPTLWIWIGVQSNNRNGYEKDWLILLPFCGIMWEWVKKGGELS